MNEREVRESLDKKPGLFYGYNIALAIFCITLIVFGIRLTYGIFFNPMASQFGWLSATVSSVFSLSIIIEGMFGVVMGKLNDKFGPRMVLTICGILLGAGYLLMTSVTSLWQMYLFYGVLVGIGMGGMVVPILTTISRWFITRRALMAGVVLSGTGIGTLVLAPLSEWIISNHSWQTAYLAMGITVLVIVITASQFLKRDPESMGLTPYLKDSPREKKSRPVVRDLTLKQAVHTRQFWLFLVVLLSYGYVGYSMVVHLVPYVVDAGVSPATAAGVMAVFGVAGIPGRIVMGGVADRIGNKEVFIICFIVYAASVMSILFVPEVWVFYIAGALLGLTTGGILSTSAAFVAELFGLKSHGEIFGVLGFANTIGGALGPFWQAISLILPAHI